MKAEILATGDEITTGSVIDSNSSYIAEKLEEAGIKVIRHTSVPDDMDSLVGVFRELSDRADIAVITGGLGPTSDDLTAEAAAKAVGVALALDVAAQQSMEAYFNTLKRPISLSNQKQALLPKGAECLVNPVGTAPGFFMRIGKCASFFLPGVPHEMKRMLSDVVLPRIEKLQGSNKSSCAAKSIPLFGLPESKVNELFYGFETHFPEIKLGFRAEFPIIHVKFYAKGKDKGQVDQILKEATRWAMERIGNWAFSVESNSMEAEIGNLLRGNKETLAVAESCTGGLISHLLTNIPGSSEYFLFSGVTYSNKAKIDLLGVSPRTLEKHGAVHEETVKEMALGVKKLSGAAYGLATSGVAGPGGGTREKPVGTVCVGIATPEHVTAHRFQLSFASRTMNKKIFAVTALDLLRKEILAG